MLITPIRSSTLIIGLLIVCTTLSPVIADEFSCPGEGHYLQVLGAGGPESDDGFASSGYLIWLDGKARLLIDVGGGVPLRFEQAKANLADLDAIIFTHFHVDHSAGLPALIKASYFGSRARDLPILGPGGNDYLPSPSQFLNRLFSTDGVYPYLNEYITAGQGSYMLRPVDINLTSGETWRDFQNERVALAAISVHHGPLPALAWRVDINGKGITFSGDTSGRGDALNQLAKGSQLLVAHNAVPEEARGAARALHMTPSRIGVIAATAEVAALVLSHRMTRTIGEELTTTSAIRENYTGPLRFAKDLECFPF